MLFKIAINVFKKITWQRILLYLNFLDIAWGLAVIEEYILLSIFVAFSF